MQSHEEVSSSAPICLPRQRPQSMLLLQEVGPAWGTDVAWGGGSPGSASGSRAQTGRGLRVACQPLPQKRQALETPIYPHPLPRLLLSTAQPNLSWGILASSLAP